MCVLVAILLRACAVVFAAWGRELLSVAYLLDANCEQGQSKLAIRLDFYHTHSVFFYCNCMFRTYYWLNGIAGCAMPLAYLYHQHIGASIRR